MEEGQIWLVDDDVDDNDIVKEVLTELEIPNELVLLKSAKEAIARLEETRTAPFIIVSALNLPDITGFELRKALLERNSKIFKSVPFIFWATQATEDEITQAYDLGIHGFFIKEGSFKDIKDTFSRIIQYWRRSKMPAKTEKNKFL